MCDENVISDALEETGFELEYEISNLLESNGWTTITNRYYLDSFTNNQREIDILSYKAKRLERLDFYFTLVISCKKSNMPWVFLTKPKIDAVNYKYKNIAVENTSPMLKYVNIENKIEDALKKSDWFEDINIKETIFAYQVADKVRKKPANDRPIFESIITTINAMEYERKMIRARKEKENIYCFCLLSIADTKMYKSCYINRDKKVSMIDDAYYYNRFIVNNEENEYKIHFVTKTAFSKVLKLKEKICGTIFRVIEDAYNDYYGNFFLKDRGMNPYERKFMSTIVTFVNHLSTYESEFKEFDQLKFTKCNFAYNYIDDCIYIDLVPSSPEAIDNTLNNSKHVHEAIRKRFYETFAYEGDFCFGLIDYESSTILSQIYW